jgi:hypothetical protein
MRNLEGIKMIIEFFFCKSEKKLQARCPYTWIKKMHTFIPILTIPTPTSQTHMDFNIQIQSHPLTDT